MRIKELHEVVAELPFLNAGRGMWATITKISFQYKLLRLISCPTALRDRCQGDLQGREHYHYQTSASLRLLGEWLPQVLCDDVLPSLGLPAGRIRRTP